MQTVSDSTPDRDGGSHVTFCEGLIRILTLSVKASLLRLLEILPLALVYGLGTFVAAIGSANAAAPTLATLYSFCSQSNCTDGVNPASDLISDPTGNLFGTTAAAGTNTNGTVFELVNNGAGSYSFSTLATFAPQGFFSGGVNPGGGLVIDAAGDLFGTTYNGGIYGQGTVFEIANSDGTYATAPNTLVNFYSLLNGRNPKGDLIIYAGNLFGTTEAGGSAIGAQGTVFEVTSSGLNNTPLSPTSSLLAPRAERNHRAV